MPSKMKQAHTIHLFRMLSKVCKKNKAGFAIYKEGQDDITVAVDACVTWEDAENPFKFEMIHVSTLRRNLFGKFPPADKPTRRRIKDGETLHKELIALDWNERISNIVDRIASLEQWASERPVQGFKKT